MDLPVAHGQLWSPSILDDLGQEVTGIVAPVSICMAITVILVRLLNPDGSGSYSSAVVIASLAYSEDTADTSSQKFGGALLNAVIFAGIMAGMTFILVLLFKYGCFRVIYTYMAFAVFDIFFLITSLVALELLQVLGIHIDAFSFTFGMLNFAVVGTAGVLFVPIPLLAKQGYMVWTGIMTAYIFTWVPEWTSWVLICVMALYDIAAVLIPGGPLNMLVKVAMERQEMLPGLVYEARPARGPYTPNALRRAAPGSDNHDVEAARALTASAVIETASASHNSLDSTTNGSSSADYVPPEVPLVGHASGGSNRSRQPSGNHSNSRLSMLAMPGPLIQGGSAQVAPEPHSGPLSGGGSLLLSSSADARPSSDAGPHHHTTRGPGPVGEGKEVSSDGSSATWQRLPADEPQALLPEGRRSDHATPPAAAAAAAAGTGSGALAGRRSGTGIGSHTLTSRVSSSAGSAALGPLGRQHGLGPLSADPISQPHQPTAHQQLTVRDAGPASGIGRNMATTTAPVQHPAPTQTAPQQDAQATEQNEIELPDSIKLGLGDFIFYSMLVGRAAMYDFMTVFASYLGIIAGLGITLLCLAFYQKALPALPFSIALGVLFYFLTRILLEPFLVPMASTLTYF